MKLAWMMPEPMRQAGAHDMGFVISFPSTDSGWSKAQHFIDCQEAEKRALTVSAYNLSMDEEHYDNRSPRHIFADERKSLIRHIKSLSTNILSCIKEIRDIRRELEIIPGIIEKQEARIELLNTEMQEIPKFSAELRKAVASKKRGVSVVERMRIKMDFSAAMEIERLWDCIRIDRIERVKAKASIRVIDKN